MGQGASQDKFGTSEDQNKEIHRKWCKDGIRVEDDMKMGMREGRTMLFGHKKSKTGTDARTGIRGE